MAKSSKAGGNTPKTVKPAQQKPMAMTGKKAGSELLNVTKRDENRPHARPKQHAAIQKLPENKGKFKA